MNVKFIGTVHIDYCGLHSYCADVRWRCWVYVVCEVDSESAESWIGHLSSFYRRLKIYSNS